MNKRFMKKRPLRILDTVALSPMTKDALVKNLMRVPVEPISATVMLIGVPGVISAFEDPKVATVYRSASFPVIDGMPFVKKARRKGMTAERCAAPDIMGPIFEASIKEGKTHYFYGTTDETLARLKANVGVEIKLSSRNFVLNSPSSSGSALSGSNL